MGYTIPVNGGSSKGMKMSDAMTESKLRAYLERRFPASKGLADDASLLDRGVIDSLGILDVAQFLSSELAIEVEDDDLVPENFDSLAALIQFVRSREGR